MAQIKEHYKKPLIESLHLSRMQKLMLNFSEEVIIDDIPSGEEF